MKIIKKLVSLTMVCMMTLNLAISVFATEQNIDTGADPFSILENESVVLPSGEEVHLYKTYCNNSDAMERINEDLSEFIAHMRDLYNLPALTNESFDEYAGYAFSVDIDEKYADSAMKFASFVDIYENKAKNDQIIEYIDSLSNNNTRSVKSNDEILDDLYYLLPYGEIERISRPVVMSSYSVTDAVTYATTYAVNRNTAYDYVSNADCTNFASQILKAGGYNETSSWYSGSTLLGGKSDRWWNADYFMRMIGVAKKTTSFSSFSGYLSKGSFIAYDREGDGDWNHMGFVTAVGSSATTNGVTYTNFKVAQHTTNYHLWVSSENNGWEKLYDGTCYFAYSNPLS